VKDEDIHRVIAILREKIKRWNLPVVTEVAVKTKNPFKVLISCMLSLRTKDEVTKKASERLFRIADDAERMIKLPVGKIEEVIYPVGFYRNKAKAIKKVCQIIVKKYKGKVPSELDELLSLPGVGRKTANLVLTVGFGKAGICVDTHVHRITNRWGYVKTKTPEQTEFALREKLPRTYWIEFNSLLVNFGQRICRPVSPFCSRCCIEIFCEKVGVKKRR